MNICNDTQLLSVLCRLPVEFPHLVTFNFSLWAFLLKLLLSLLSSCFLLIPRLVPKSVSFFYVLEWREEPVSFLT